MTFLLLLPISLAALIVYAILFVGRRDRRLPHGPPTLPIIGNLHQLPTKGAHLKFTEWSRQYGGIFSLKLGTGTAIVLTDRRLVKQLIDKKSGIYSNRPHSFVSHDLITGGDHVLVSFYGEQWRKYRKVIHQDFMESVVEKNYLPIQHAEGAQLMRDFMLDPGQHMLHPKRYSNSIAMSIIWGVRSPTVNTSHMQRLYNLMEHWSIVMEPGNTPPVDIFPFLHWVPQRLFNNWRSRASTVGNEMNSLYNDMLTLVEKRREVVGSKECFMDKVLDQNEKLGFSRHQLYFLSGTMMEGASDTTAATIIAFVQAMTKWPEIQVKAQKEMDAVIGENRSPVWPDHASLPYVAACVKEVMRWRPMGPLGFPHCLDEDDWVDGKLLPKGSVVFINVWGLHRDENKFPHPDVFDPDRYKGITALAPELAAAVDFEARDHYGYGSGRRICPGIHLAERNLFIAISKLLWAFSFAPGRDASGEIVEPDIDPVTGYSEGFIVCAKPFACDIKVRSEPRRKTIIREFDEAQRNVFSRFET